QARGLGRPHRERIDVEPPRREEAGDTGEHAGLVFDEDRDRVERPAAARAVAHTIGASAGSLVGVAPSGSRMMSSFEAPAGTIGKTISRGSTRKSITTLRSSTEKAFSMTASTSPGSSARSPTQPDASASSVLVDISESMHTPR